VDDDGETVLHYLQLEYGQTPSYTWDNPANKQDAEWTYSFTGWTPATFSEVQGPQTYVANYDKTKREYTITWTFANNAIAIAFPTATAISNTAADAEAVKVLHNGMLLIRKGDKTYNIMGQTVK
jgi:hypothetical protein